MTLRALGWSTSTLFLAWCATGCGSSTPAPPKAGLEVTGIGLGANAPSGEACNIDTAQFGLYAKDGEPPSSANVGDPLTDGSGNVSINCKVSGGSGTYYFNGSLQENAASLTINGGKVTKGTSSTGMVTYTGAAEMNLYTPNFNGTNLSSSSPMDQPCTITVHQIAGGRIWADFACSDMQHSPSTDCSVKGTFVFENCDQ
jgi:hypothetical protein